MTRRVARVKAELEERGLLMLSDKDLASLTGLVAGEPVRGSWWSHPAAHDIVRIGGALEDDPDVTTAKLVAGKVTYVHRRLWPALIAVACSREPWQTRGLSPGGKRLLAEVERVGSVRTDSLPRSGRGSFPGLGDLVRDVERRLLVHADEVHTESGAHAKRLESWEHFARPMRMRSRQEPDVSDAKRLLEQAAGRLADGDAMPRLPWA